jgi:imidazolonepropionase-like amidohydrolase
MPREPKIVFWFLLPFAALYSQPPDATTLVLKSARLYDGKSDRMVSPGLVVVRGDRIESVGSGTPVPPGSVVIDLGDATLLPGFIDAHTHLVLNCVNTYLY